MQTRRAKRSLEDSPDCPAPGPKSAPKKEVPQVRRRTTKQACPLTLTLYVRWFSPQGRTKVNKLLLRPVTSVEALQGISKNLVSRAFPSGPERPDYLTSEEFLKFTPTEDFMSLPGEIFRTEFRLVVTHEGWEYTVLERELGAHVDPLRKMLVTVIEFESSPLLMVGHALGLRVSLIAYPVISIKKDFLEHIHQELETNPDFKGQL
ncbi:g11949 [Coccomyxa viridis]|uniref:G11949 protein n=1 Tax=Coccomyxa viridis TaxID=1274662 RepID=A0ABP1GDA5_9CHLO